MDKQFNLNEKITSNCFNIILLSVFVLIVSCNTKSNKSVEPSTNGIFFPEVEQRTVILGAIDNIKEFPNAPRTIELCVDDISFDTQHSFETAIDEDGKFIFDIPLYHSINTYLNYGDARITPYLFVNDTLKMECSIGKKGYQIGIVSAVFDKKHDKFQNQFKNNYKWLNYDMIGGFRDKLPKNESVNELKNRYLNFEKELLSEIDSRVKRDSLNNTLKDYLTFSARYSIYTQIIRSGRIIKDKNEKKSFFAFINDSIIYNKKAMTSSDYRIFLSYYNINDVALINQQQAKAKTVYDRAKRYVQFVLAKREGIWGEYLAAARLFSFASQDESISQTLSDSLSNLIGSSFSDTYIRQYLLALYSKNGQKTEDNKNLKLPADAVLYKYDFLSGEQLFNKIVADNAGKVIYVDFWGTWCSSCITQMPYSQKIHEIFKGEDVSFVYLCSRSDAKSWEMAIKKHQIKGNHINLNSLQYEYLKDRFSIVGVPRYMLIDKYGKIVNADAPVPENEELVTAVKKLLTN